MTHLSEAPERPSCRATDTIILKGFNSPTLTAAVMLRYSMIDTQLAGVDETHDFRVMYNEDLALQLHMQTFFHNSRFDEK